MNKLFVVGFIYNRQLVRIGLRLYNVDTQEMSTIPFPSDADYLNMAIHGGIVKTKGCNVGGVPQFNAVGDTTDLSQLNFRLHPRSASAWVLHKYSDGRLMLLSADGQLKTVTTPAAFAYHLKYKIVGCREVDYDLVVDTPNYI